MAKCNAKDSTLVKDKLNLIILKLKSIVNVKTDKHLADILGVDKNLFASWKHQRKEIPIQYLIDFCNIYNVSLDYLLRSGEQEEEIGEDSIKMPYYEDYNFTGYYGYIITKKSFSKKNTIDYTNLRAVKIDSNEMPRTIPRDSIGFFDFNIDKATSTPNIFLFQATGTIFLRELAITPNGEYFIRSENDKIEDIKIEPEKIEILAKLIGATKWQN